MPRWEGATKMKYLKRIKWFLNLYAIPGFFELILAGILFLVLSSCVSSIVNRRNMVSKTARELANISFGNMWEKGEVG